MNKTYLQPMTFVRHLAFEPFLLSGSDQHSSSSETSEQSEELIFDISDAEGFYKGFEANAKPFEDEFVLE